MWRWLLELWARPDVTDTSLISPLVDKSALAEFVRLLREADMDDLTVADVENSDPV